MKHIKRNSGYNPDASPSKWGLLLDQTIRLACILGLIQCSE